MYLVLVILMVLMPILIYFGFKRLFPGELRRQGIGKGESPIN